MAATSLALLKVNKIQLQVLRCEMARKNMYIRDDAAAAAKRGRVGGEYNPYATAPTASPVPAYYTPAPVKHFCFLAALMLVQVGMR